ncbi:phosphatase PAP2 family protein [Deinococcus metalli]|uniref:phosphatase PAP2 family protein n=1 Tax=Deinococcus metalli TaxID=1141878 RepID=UPI0036131860
MLRFLLGILLPLVLVGMIAEDVLEQQRFAFETPLLTWIHAHSSPALTSMSVFLHTFGGPVPMGAVFMVIVLGLRFMQRRPQALFALLGLGSAVGIAFGMKVLFHRPRPELWTRLVSESGPSFPSGHTTVAAALVTFVVLLAWHSSWRWPALVLGVVYAGLMGYSRLVLGVHFPTDVLAGWLTGVACVLGAYSLLGTRLRPAVEPVMEGHAAQDRRIP